MVTASIGDYKETNKEENSFNVKVTMCLIYLNQLFIPLLNELLLKLHSKQNDHTHFKNRLQC